MRMKYQREVTSDENRVVVMMRLNDSTRGIACLELILSSTVKGCEDSQRRWFLVTGSCRNSQISKEVPQSVDEEEARKRTLET